MSPQGRGVDVAAEFTGNAKVAHRVIAIAVTRRTVDDRRHQPAELARTGAIDISGAITRRVPLADAVNGVLDDMERGSGHLRTVIEVQ